MNYFMYSSSLSSQWHIIMLFIKHSGKSGKKGLINEVSSERKLHNDVSFIELLFLDCFYSVSVRSDGGIR